MNSDISRLLQEWPYDPKNPIRIIPADDGRSVLQVRLPLGIEQYELDGRPDGKTYKQHDTVLDEVNSRLQEHILQHAGDTGFSLTEDDMDRLQEEAILIYYRYLMLFQVSEYERVERDTGHNLRVCELMERYTDNTEARNSVLQFKPYILRMHAMAQIMLCMQSDQESKAGKIVEDTIQSIESLEAIDSPAFQFERLRSLKYLYAVRKQIADSVLPVNPVQRLQQELSLAVAEENYERAAELRDRLRNIGRDEGY
ncbi:MAG: UvrB/UvrC motif-containing protein [Spirochaeta sp.]